MREYDATYCSDLKELYSFIDKANKYRYEIISVTEKCGYTVVFKK